MPEQKDIDEVSSEYDREVDDISSRISEGHAYREHVEKEPREISECFDRVHFSGMINETIRSPDIAEPRPGGGMFFYSRKNNLVVIVDPTSGDNGTAFRVAGGESGARSYINKMKVSNVK